MKRHPRTSLPAAPRHGIGLVLLLCSLPFASGAARAAESDEPSGQEELVKIVRMDAQNWKWVPDVVRVKEGTRVVLRIRSLDATHRFDLKAYGLRVVLPQDETTEVAFTADRPGEFRWRCGRPCGDGCPKMTGRLIVVAEHDAGDANEEN